MAASGAGAGKDGTGADGVVVEYEEAIAAIGEEDETWKGRSIPERHGIHMAHEAFRKDMTALVKAIAAFPRTVAGMRKLGWKFASSAAWYHQVFLPILHEHHDIEETIVIPHMRKAGAPIPRKVKDDHPTLVALSEKIGSKLNELADVRKSGRVEADQDLQDMVEALEGLVLHFQKSMLEHFAEEEETVHPLTRKYMTPEQFEAMNEEIKHVASEGELGCLPLAWMANTFTNKPEETMFRHEFPCMVLCVLECCVVPSYRSKQLAWIQACYDDRVPIPEEFV